MRDIVVNLQGDEPLMPASADRSGRGIAGERTPSADIATLALPLESRRGAAGSERGQGGDRPAAARPVFQPRADSLARARRTAGCQPAQSAGARGTWASMPIGSALLRLAALAPSALELLEKLEQLRALEHGMDIRVADARASRAGM